MERRGPVTVLTLNRPEVRNCIDAESAGLISEAIEAFAEDDAALVMVVTGAGQQAFCAGADLKDIEAIIDRHGGRRRAPLGFSDLEPGKPRIAAVEGWAAGGGIELACWCDFAVAGQGAVFAALNRRVGVPWVDGGTQRMTRRIGTGNALYILETGERIDARLALSMGLVQEVVLAGRALPRALELADRIAAYPRSSLRADRASVLEGLGRPLDDGLETEAVTGREAENEQLRTGVARFLDRKKEEGGAAGALHP